MKLFDFAIIIALSSAFTFTGGAEFYFKEDRIKFPDTKAGEVLHHEFEFTNVGTEPLIIEGYSVACTCTKLTYPQEPIAPGSKGRLELSFDTAGKYGFQNRTIQVQANTAKSIYTLRFKVYVIEA